MWQLIGWERLKEYMYMWKHLCIDLIYVHIDTAYMHIYNYIYIYGSTSLLHFKLKANIGSTLENNMYDIS